MISKGIANLSTELLENLNLTNEEQKQPNDLKKVKLFLSSLENFKNTSKYLEEKSIPFSLDSLPFLKFRLRRLEDFSFNNITYKGIYVLEKIEKQNPNKEPEILEFIQLSSFREIQDIKKGVEIFFTHCN